MAAVLLLILLSSQIYLSDASGPAATPPQPFQEHSRYLYPPPNGPWSSRRSLQQQIPVAPPQTLAEVSRQSPKPPPPVDQQPPPPPEPPKAAGNGTADTAGTPAPPPSPDPGPIQRRTLQLPPHVYLISFVMLLAIMGGLLTCHCFRMCRIARRMRHAAELGVTISSAGSMLSKRTPQSVIESLPVSKYSSIQSQRQAQSAASGDKASAGAGAAAASGGNRMNSFVAAAMQLREQLSRQSGISSRSFGSSSAAVQAAGTGAGTAAAAAPAGGPEAPQQLRHSSSTNSIPGWRRSLSFGRKSAAAGEITAADGDVSSHAAAAVAASGNSSDASSNGQRPLAAGAEAPGADVAARRSSSAGAEPCAICFDDFSADDDVKQLPCNHYFHVNCIDEWLVRDTTCPLCKGTVLDEALIEEQQRVTEQLEASLGGLGSGAMARRRQQQQQTGGRQSRRSRRSRRSASNPGSSSAAVEDDTAPHQDQHHAANSSDSRATPTTSAAAQQSGSSAAAVASSAAAGGDIEMGIASRSGN